jgi:type I restriction enzyme S subunit
MSRPDIEKYRLKQGDLLVCEGGEVGRCAVWESPLEECYYQKALHRLRPLRGFDPRLMAAYLRSWSEGGLLQSHVTQTSIAHLPREKFMEVPLPVPPAKEQHAIAAALSDVDALLAGLDRLIAKKRDLKQAAMQQLLTGQTRLPGFQGEWEVKRLGDIFQIAAGTSKSAFIVENGDYWVCDMGSVSTTGKLIVSKRTNYRGDYLAAGDLIMPKDDIGGGNIIGRVGYIDADHTYVLGDHVYHLRAEVGNPLFLSYAINSHRTNSQLRRKVIGSAQLGLGRKSVTEQEIQFPPVEEQTAIASALSDMDAELTALEARRDKTRALKQAMMQELLTGKTRLV